MRNYDSIAYGSGLFDSVRHRDRLRTAYEFEQRQAEESLRAEAYGFAPADAPWRTRAGRREREKPYETVSHMGERGWAVGPYGLTADLIYDWLLDVAGDPPDRKRLRALVREGKLSPRLSASIRCGRFQVFLDKLKDGSQPLPLEMQELLPRKLQKTIALHLARKLAAGETLTGSYQPRLEGSHRAIEWQDVNSRVLAAAYGALGQELWREGRFKASRLDFGRLACADAVSGVMLRAGIPGVFSSGVPGIERDIRRLGGQEVREPRPGDIVVGYREPGQSHHVGVVADNGTVIHNSSARRQLVQGDLLRVFNYRNFAEIKFLRLPAQA
jgi:hypothetical protein